MSETQGSAPAQAAPDAAAPVTENDANDGENTEADVKADAKDLTPSQKKKFKLTVDGEEVEEEIDFANEDDIRRRLQLARAAEKRMAEAKSAKNKAFDIVAAFEKDPANILKRLGPKGREVAEKFLLEQIQEDMLTPEEKEYRELKKYKEMTEAEKAKAKEAAEAQGRQAREAKYAQEFQDKIITALDKSGLPKSEPLVKRMAGILYKNLELGLDLTADDLVEEVKKETLDLVRALTKDADGNQLEAMFGKDIANKIRKADLKRLQEKQNEVFQSPKPVQSAQPSRKSEKKDRPMSMEEWKAQLEERIK